MSAQPSSAAGGTGTSPDTAHPEHAKGVAAGLHMIATPIGAARDITLRALDLLAGADVLVAEDTRSLRRLMQMHGVAVGERPLLAYHDHNGPRMRPRLMAALAEGRSVVYASEAGTPLVADPGFQLVRAALAEGHPVHAAPGPSAVLAALVVSGMPSDRFCFMGFPPAQGGPRRRFLAEAAAIPATIILYESPHRVHRLLAELVESFGKERSAALCRELTKRFEEVVRLPLGELAAVISGRDLKGEIVLVIDRMDPAQQSAEDLQPALEDALRTAMESRPLKEAVDEVTRAMGLRRRDVYQLALQLKDAT